VATESWSSHTAAQAIQLQLEYEYE